MREIRFRGKTKSTNEWVYGVPIFARTNCDNGHYEIIMLIEYETELEWSAFVDSEEVFEETICQYTGLKDKNGKEIYEGDIVKSVTIDTNKTIYAQIKYGKYRDPNNDDSELGFFIDDGEYRLSMFNGECAGFNLPKMIEVVGNIFDNSELLEGE